jgi:para-nitrobenzyl esterase
MVGTNRDEQNLFLFMDPSQVERRFGLIPRVKNPPEYLATGEYLSRAWRMNGAEQPALAMVQSGHKQVFAYRFDWDAEPVVAGTDLSKFVGAAHGLEIPFVFGHFHLGRMGDFLFTPENLAGRERLSAAMRAYWGSFARTGVPVAEGQAAWLPFDAAPGAPAWLAMDDPRGGGIRMASGLESREALLSDLSRDARLPTAEARCRVRKLLTGWRRALSAEEYAAVEECRGIALDGP